MKIVTESSRRNLKTAVGMTMDAALTLSGAELNEQDGISEMVADLALEVWPDVTPRDLVTLGMGVRYASAPPSSRRTWTRTAARRRSRTWSTRCARRLRTPRTSSASTYPGTATTSFCGSARAGVSEVGE